MTALFILTFKLILILSINLSDYLDSLSVYFHLFEYTDFYEIFKWKWKPMDRHFLFEEFEWKWIPTGRKYPYCNYNYFELTQINEYLNSIRDLDLSNESQDQSDSNSNSTESTVTMKNYMNYTNEIPSDSSSDST